MEKVSGGEKLFGSDEGKRKIDVEFDVDFASEKENEIKNQIRTVNKFMNKEAEKEVENGSDNFIKKDEQRKKSGSGDKNSATASYIRNRAELAAENDKMQSRITELEDGLEKQKSRYLSNYSEVMISQNADGMIKAERVKEIFESDGWNWIDEVGLPEKTKIYQVTMEALTGLTFVTEMLFQSDTQKWLYAIHDEPTDIVIAWRELPPPAKRG